MTRWRAAFGLALAATLLAALPQAVVGQDGPPPGRRPNPRERLFKMMDAYIVSHLQEGLELSDEQLVKVLPAVRQLQADRRDFQHRRMRALHELRRQLRSGSTTQARVAERLAELKAVETEEPATLQRHRDAIDAALTPLQQAKFRVLEVEFERKLREIFNKVRRQQRRDGERREPRPE